MKPKDIEFPRKKGFPYIEISVGFPSSFLFLVSTCLRFLTVAACLCVAQAKANYNVNELLQEIVKSLLG